MESGRQRWKAKAPMAPPIPLSKYKNNVTQPKGLNLDCPPFKVSHNVKRLQICLVASWNSMKLQLLGSLIFKRYFSDLKFLGDGLLDYFTRWFSRIYNSMVT